MHVTLTFFLKTHCTISAARPLWMKVFSKTNCRRKFSFSAFLVQQLMLACRTVCTPAWALKKNVHAMRKHTYAVFARLTKLSQLLRKREVLPGMPGSKRKCCVRDARAKLSFVPWWLVWRFSRYVAASLLIHYLEVLLQRCIVAVHNVNGPYELCMCGQSSSGQTVLAMPRDVHTAFPRERFLCFKRNELQYMCKRWVCILCFTVFNLRTCSDCPVWKACSVCLK